MRGIPIINRTPAGEVMDYEEVGDDYDYLPILAEDAFGDPDAFAIQVSDDSMSPAFHDGDLAICSPRKRSNRVTWRSFG